MSHLTSSSVLAALLLGTLAPTVARAQSERVLEKARQLIQPGAPVADLRRGFQMISDALRETPDEARPDGHWLRGEAAAMIGVQDGRSLTSEEVALDAFEDALRLGYRPPALGVFTTLDAHLVASSEPAAADGSLDVAVNAWEAAQLAIRAEGTSRKLGLSNPVERARRTATAVRAALAADEVRPARRLFEQLEAEGGFVEPLAIEVARKVEAQESPHTAFLFLTGLQERYPNRRDLLLAYVDLCADNGWVREAKAALLGAEVHFQNDYADHVLLAGHFDRIGEDTLAIRHYKDALQFMPRAYEANAALAELLARAGDAAQETDPVRAEAHRREATANLTLVLEANPRNADALRALAALQEALGDEEDAKATLARLAALPPEDPVSESDDRAGQ